MTTTFEPNHHVRSFTHEVSAGSAAHWTTTAAQVR